jgi:hypothetical protein
MAINDEPVTGDHSHLVTYLLKKEMRMAKKDESSESGSGK